MTKAKINIPDDPALRAALDQACEVASREQLCRYALQLAARILQLVHVTDANRDTVDAGFRINEQWQQGHARMHDVRQASFRIHRLARASENAAVCAALRAAGHAVATAHMRQHAMVASDYALRVISLLHPGCMEAIRKERLRQISCLLACRTRGGWQI